MNINLDSLQGALTILIAFGTALAPIVFYVMEITKPLFRRVPSEYLQLVAVIIGGLIGVGLVYLAPSLGVEGISLSTGIMGGMIGGYISTKQYDRGVKVGIQKTEDPNY